MNEFRPVTKETKSQFRKIALLFFSFAAFFAVFPVAYFFTDMGSFPWFLLILSSACVLMAIFVLNVKREYTEAGKEAANLRHRDFWDKWYGRYLLAVFAVMWAFFCFKVWLSGETAPGILILLVNPWIGAFLAITSLIIAWEITLGVIVIGIGFLLYTGIAALPESVAITVGACLISLTVWFTRRRFP